MFRKKALRQVRKVLPNKKYMHARLRFSYKDQFIIFFNYVHRGQNNHSIKKNSKLAFFNSGILH